MESWRPLNRPAARHARVAGLVILGLSSAGAAGLILLPLAGRAFVRVIELVVAACVWLATSIGVGVSVWDVLGTLGRATVAALLTPAGSLALSILVVIGIIALYFLQRLLESEEGSSA